MDPDLFFPAPGGDNSRAKAVCASCPIREACLEHGVAFDEPGIWGGLSHAQRREIRRARRRAA